MRESRENASLRRAELIYRTFEQAQTLFDEFHATFPDTEVKTIISAARGDSKGEKWKVAFEGEIDANQEILEWLKAKGVK